MHQSTSQLTSNIQTDVERKYLSFAFYGCLLPESVRKGLFVCLFSCTYERIKQKCNAVKQGNVREGHKNPPSSAERVKVYLCSIFEEPTWRGASQDKMQEHERYDRKHGTQRSLIKKIC